MPTGIGTYQDFRIYNDEFYGGFNEVMEQRADVFGPASNGTIQLVSLLQLGHFTENAFFKNIGDGLIRRRDGTTTSAATKYKMPAETIKNPKLLRAVGPLTQTLGGLKLANISEQMFSMKFGEQVAIQVILDYLNTLIGIGVTCIGKQTTGGVTGQGSVVDHGNAGETMRNLYLIEAKERMGDAAGRINAWVMHSKPWHDLMKEQATNMIDRVAGATIYEGTVGTGGIPTVVVDSPDLVNTDGIASGTDSYYTMGLTENALVATESEEKEMVVDVPTGGENLYLEIQGEHAFNVECKGYSYTAAGENPTDAALRTPGNWTNRFDDIKTQAGVLLETA